MVETRAAKRRRMQVQGEALPQLPLDIWIGNILPLLDRNEWNCMSQTDRGFNGAMSKILPPWPKKFRVGVGIANDSPDFLDTKFDMSPNGEWVACSFDTIIDTDNGGVWRGCLEFFHCRTGSHHKSIYQHGYCSMSIPKFSPCDSNVVASIDENDQINIWDLGSKPRPPRRNFGSNPLPGFEVTFLDFSWDGKLILCTHDCFVDAIGSRVKKEGCSVWSVADGRCIQCWIRESPASPRYFFSPNDNSQQYEILRTGPEGQLEKWKFDLQRVDYNLATIATKPPIPSTENAFRDETGGEYEVFGPLGFGRIKPCVASNKRIVSFKLRYQQQPTAYTVKCWSILDGSTEISVDIPCRIMDGVAALRSSADRTVVCVHNSENNKLELWCAQSGNRLGEISLSGGRIWRQSIFVTPDGGRVGFSREWCIEFRDIKRAICW